MLAFRSVTSAVSVARQDVTSFSLDIIDAAKVWFDKTIAINLSLSRPLSSSGE